jgi:hypothetical protein
MCKISRFVCIIQLDPVPRSDSAIDSPGAEDVLNRPTLSMG